MLRAEERRACRVFRSSGAVVRVCWLKRSMRGGGGWSDRVADGEEDEEVDDKWEGDEE